MKHSFLKLSILSLLIIGVTGATALAHGPETYKELCKEKFLDAWFEDNQGKASGQCNPSKPPNIEAGITSKYGGTTKNYPFGLCYPSFNNYTDEIDKAFDTPTGMDPYGSQPPLFKDERNFFKVRKWTSNGQAQWVDYKDEQIIDYGETLTFMIYLHNDGDPCFNEGNTIPKNKFYSNWNTTSKNTKVKVSPSPETKISKPTTFEASIWSDNAVNSKGQIAPTKNDVVIRPKDNKEITLSYNVDSAAYTDYDQKWNYKEHDIKDTKSLFGSGMPLTTLLNGSPKVAEGVHFASEPYIGVIVFTVKAGEAPVVKTPMCKNLTGNLEPTNVNGKNGYKVNYTTQTEDGFIIPQITFHSSEKGTFYTGIDAASNKILFSEIGESKASVKNGVQVYFVPTNENKNIEITVDVDRIKSSITSTKVDGKKGYKINYENISQTKGIQNIILSTTSSGTFYRGNASAANKTLFTQLGSNNITVEEGEEIYFVPTFVERGAPSPTIFTAIDDACRTKFNISAKIKPALTECKNSTVTIKNIATQKEVSCTLNKEYSIEARFYEDETQKKEIESGRTVVLWNSTDPEGLFYNPLQYIFDFFAKNKKTQGIKGPVQGPNIMKYVGRGKVTAQLLEVDGNKHSPTGADLCSLSIPECDNACRELQITYNETPEVGKASRFQFKGTDIFGEALPELTQLLITKNTGGILTNNDNQSSETSLLTPLKSTVEIKGAEVIGKITAEISAQDPLYSAQCKDQITVQEPLTCKNIEVTVDGLSSPVIKAGNFYKMKAKSTFSTANPEAKITYSSTQGLFFVPKVTGQDAVDQSTLAFAINAASKVKTSITSNDAETTYDNQFLQINKEVIVQDNQVVIFLPFTDVTLENGINAITVKVTGRSEEECTQKLNIYPIDQVCKELKFKTFPEKFDPTKEMIIRLESSSLGDFNGELEFKTTNGKFYFPKKDSEIASIKTFSIEEASSGIIYTGGKYEDIIEIKAIGAMAGTCTYTFTNNPLEVTCESLELSKPSGTWKEEDIDNDKQEFILNVTTTPVGNAGSFKYKWQANGGEFKEALTDKPTNTLEDIDLEEKVSVTVYAIDSTGNVKNSCTLTKHIKTLEDEDATINKVVYDTQNKKWADTINVSGKREVNTAKGKFLTWLGSKYQYVTYLATLDPGTSRSAEVWEEELRNGYITASNTKKGKFNFVSIAVVAESNKGKKYAVYVDKDFKSDRYYNQAIDGKNDFKDFNHYSEKEEYFEKNYECGNNDSDEICIENIDQLESDFQKGQRIELGNLDSASKVHFIYQTQNDTAVTEEFCKSIIKKFQGCGEEFNNTINFTAYRKDNHSDELNTGKDSAKAIAICPYVLTRQGGDVFFHSALDTGIDVSACYKVENCEGPCIVREQSKKKKITSTGSSDIEDVILKTPTHDVCKLSNDPDSDLPSAYKDVLKNFSSSVCEFKADVAEIWTEKNINNSIKSNIEKIARFGLNKGSHNFKSPISVPFSNGVYVQEGGTLTIGGSNTFSVGSTEPAAQTYIVRNGDLVIKSNVIYNDQNVTPTKPKTIPSVAFIVINGDIKIDNSVTRIDAIIMSVDSENSGKGKVLSSQNSPTFDNILTINGSLIGDVANLFENRQAIGDPLKDQSSITIKYDERILLNTPPGLSELIDINQLKIAN